MKQQSPESIQTDGIKENNSMDERVSLVCALSVSVFLCVFVLWLRSLHMASHCVYVEITFMTHDFIHIIFSE